MAERLGLVRPLTIFEVRLHQAEDLEAVVAWADGNGMDVVGAAGHRLRIRATADHARALGELRAVAQIEEWSPPRLVADHVARIVWGSAGLRRTATRG
jgi:hypothetical protein